MKTPLAGSPQPHGVSATIPAEGDWHEAPDPVVDGALALTELLVGILVDAWTAKHGSPTNVEFEFARPSHVGWADPDNWKTIHSSIGGEPGIGVQTLGATQHTKHIQGKAGWTFHERGSFRWDLESAVDMNAWFNGCWRCGHYNHDATIYDHVLHDGFVRPAA